MKILKDNKGSTLIVVLVLSSVALIIAAGLIYMVTEGTKISGSSKRYKTAYEAGKAGADVMYQIINTGGAAAIPLANFSIASTLTSSVGKLSKATADWPTTYDTSVAIDPADINSYDASFDLGGYKVYAKITDTVPGNSAPGGGSGSKFHSGGVTNAKANGMGDITVPSYPYIYAIEVLASNAADPMERSKVSILYQY
jgi:hypothetical protein